MNRKQLSSYIFAFLKLNPKKNKRPNIEKYDQNSFFVIQNSFKENKKYIITSNYNHIFYYKKSKLQGKKWVDIILSSKDIFEYHKKIRDDFPYCKQKKFVNVLIDDLFYWFDRNSQNSIIEISESTFDIETRTKLEKIRYFIDKKDWSNYFFNLQKLMHEQIIFLLNWKSDNLNWKDYSKNLNKELINWFEEEEIHKYFQKIEKINLYRNTISKVTIGKSETHKKLFIKWTQLTNIQKKKVAWNLFLSLIDIMITNNLIKSEKSI